LCRLIEDAYGGASPHPNTTGSWWVSIVAKIINKRQSVCITYHVNLLEALHNEKKASQSRGMGAV